jgi:hypothetical protein
MAPTEITNDFVFDASIDEYETVTPAPLPDLKVVPDSNERYVQVAPVTPYTESGNPKLDGEDISPVDTFTVHFNIFKFAPLIFVDPTYNSADDRRGLTLAGSNVRLVFRNMDDPVHDVYLPPVEIAPKTGSDTVEKELDVVVDATDKRIVITDIHGDSVISFKNTSAMNDINTWLPWQNTDMLLMFELYYYAFGDPTSKGYKWVIRNELVGHSEDSGSDKPISTHELSGEGTTSGGDILIRFGEGTPPSLLNATTVFFD